MKNFSAIADCWLEHIVLGQQYSYQIELECAAKHLKMYFGDKNSENIKGLDVEQFVKYESESINLNTGKPFSKRLIKEHIDVGRRIYEFALDNEIINCRNPFVKKNRKVSGSVQERIPIDDTQKDLILRVTSRTQIAAIIMLFCGLRRGEVIPLEWTDIDFINKKIYVTKSAERIDTNHFTTKPHTKNGKDRCVPIPDFIIPFLIYEKNNSNGNGLIYSQKNGKMHTVSSWKSGWNSYLTQLNYEYYKDTMKRFGEEPKNINDPKGVPIILERFTAHQLRHTYCTMLYFAGVDIHTASQLMGHSNVQITLETYTHLDNKYKTVNINRFNDYITRNNASYCAIGKM